MYKLLLVSDRDEVRALYQNFGEWESLGFERPFIAGNAAEGVAVLGRGRFDAVSTLLSIGEGKRFFAALKGKPEMLGIETARDEAKLRKELSAARRRLSSKEAARQTKQLDDVTRAMQFEFVNDLLRGTGFDKAKIDERIRSLKIRTVDPSRPAVTASFRLPQGDYFLAEVWRYGRERLENALRNIFEIENEEMLFILLIINPHHMRLIGLPKIPLAQREAYERMVHHLGCCQEVLSQYFELTLDIKRIVPYASLYALGEENSIRTAH